MTLNLALDTGATDTVINASTFLAIGHDAALALERVQVTTGSGVELVPRFVLPRIDALGQHRTDFPVLSLTLPPGADVDGVLGLDFFRGQTLTIDFRTGQIQLA